MADLVHSRRSSPSSSEESVKLISQFAKDWPVGDFLGPKDSDGNAIVDEWKDES